MNTLILIDIGICLLLSLIMWVIIGILWCPFRKFFHRSYSFFDASFILVYFLEQLILITLIFKYNSYTYFWASAFAIIVITTASFQKLTSESRIKKISETTTEQKILLERISKINTDLTNKYEKSEKVTKNMKKFVEEYLEEKR